MRKVRDGEEKKNEKNEKKKIMMKIAVHLRRCQSTAWTATDCNADARAKNNDEYQPSGAGGTRSPPATPYDAKLGRELNYFR